MIRTQHRTDPRRLETTVLDVLAHGGLSDTDKVEVTASAGGIVTLTGTVRSKVRRHLLATAAWTAPGVKEVVNLLRVGR
jgi:osmotically-inducible protein OsmY